MNNPTNLNLSMQRSASRATRAAGTGVRPTGWLSVAVALLGLHSAGTGVAQVAAYHANLLGISDGRTNIQVEAPVALNKWGQVAGTYGGGLSGGTHAVLWTPDRANDGLGNGISGTGTLFRMETSAGLPAGTTGTGPTSLNDLGQVAGWAYTPGKGDGNQRQSWMWKPTTLNSSTGVLHGTSGTAVTFPLLSIPGLGASSEYNQLINNKGRIAAYGISGRLLEWTPATVNGTSGTWTYDANHGAVPAAFNDAGQVAGSSCESLVWNGPYLHTGALPLKDSDVLTSALWIPRNPNECVGYVSGMNAAGHLAISAVTKANVIHAFYFQGATAKDVSGGLASHALAINAYDQIVGYADTDTRRAYLFEKGLALDLNKLNDSTNGLLLKSAIAINASGQILCTGVYPGAGASVLLTPNALVSNALQITQSQFYITGTVYKQTVSVTNLGSTPIAGPISLALTGLNGNVTLSNKSGVTFYSLPGSAYVNISASALEPGASTLNFTLEFANPNLEAIHYTPHVLGTSAPR